MSRRVVLVTGASRGIGRACAVALAADGWRVAAAGRDHEMLQSSLKQCKSTGGQAHSIILDICDLPSIQMAVEEIENSIGPIDLLVNCAAIYECRPFLEIGEDIWDRSLSTNLKGLFFCTQTVVNHMLPRKRGLILNISSIAGVTAGPLPYAVTKWAVEGFTKSLAKELTPLGIRVNAVAPGVTATRMSGHEGDKVITDPSYPLGRLARAEEIAAVVAFLASSEAEYISGSTFVIDGGLLACADLLR